MVLEAVNDAIKNESLEGRRLLVAVSGGVDSTVLLRALHECKESHRLELAVGHVQHGLRGEESRLDEAAVREGAEGYGLEAFIAEVDPRGHRAGQAGRDRLTLQESAREVRLGALRQIAEDWKADHILTAHNLDDQAETVLMRLIRGTGPTGLQGIEHRSPDGFWVRPLLSVSRSEILEFAEHHQLTWREDSSNSSDAYTRNRLRHHWIPALRDEFNPQILRAMGRLADAMQEDEKWIREVVEEVSERMTSRWADSDPKGLVWAESGWEALPDGLAFRVIRQSLHRLDRGRDVSHVHLQRVLDFLRREGVETGRAMELPGGDRVVRTASGYRLEVDPHDPDPSC